MQKIPVKCSRCQNVGDNNRVKRPRFLKIFLPFLPIKKYMCFRCLKTFYKVDLFRNYHMIGTKS